MKNIIKIISSGPNILYQPKTDGIVQRISIVNVDTVTATINIYKQNPSAMVLVAPKNITLEANSLYLIDPCSIIVTPQQKLVITTDKILHIDLNINENI